MSAPVVFGVTMRPVGWSSFRAEVRGHTCSAINIMFGRVGYELLMDGRKVGFAEEFKDIGAALEKLVGRGDPEPAASGAKGEADGD